MTRLLCSLVVVLGLAIAGCGGDDETTSTAGDTGATGGTTGATGAAESKPTVAADQIDVGDLAGPPKYEELTRATFAALENYWADRFPGPKDEYSPPAKIFAYAGSGPDCEGERAGKANALYCGDGNYIAFDQDGLAIPFFERVGYPALAFLFAHEYGHLIQTRLGIIEDYKLTIEKELNADCLAGAWFLGVEEEGIKLTQADIQSVKEGVFIAGDQPGTPWQSPDAHGTPRERFSAVSLGAEQGTQRCLTELAPGFTKR